MMKIYLILTAILTAFALLIPFVVNTVSDRTATGETVAPVTQQTEEPTDNDSLSAETVKVLKSSSGEAVEMDMFEYIVGTVAGEMPASFCIEALKAQVVASYTYARYITESSADKDVLLSDSSSVHQSYIDKTEQKEKWGIYYDEYRQKIEDAVKNVSGEYLAYDGKTAMTVFHALSENQTNSAEEIWGEGVPYLVQVNAPSNEASKKELHFTAEKFRTLFNEKSDIVFSEEDSKKWAKITVKSDIGYIRKLSVCNKTFDAIEISEILSLPSANFTAKYADGSFIFTSYGKGHGVGMSQYGAEYMAQNGKDYTEILSHFYPGTTLIKE